MLTDVRDGRLTIDDRELPLAGPVQVRLPAYSTTAPAGSRRPSNPASWSTDVRPAHDTGRQEIPLAPPRPPAPPAARGPHPPRGPRHRRRRPPGLRPVRAQRPRRHALHGLLEHPHLAAGSDPGSGTQGRPGSTTTPRTPGFATEGPSEFLNSRGFSRSGASVSKIAASVAESTVCTFTPGVIRSSRGAAAAVHRPAGEHVLFLVGQGEVGSQGVGDPGRLAEQDPVEHSASRSAAMVASCEPAAPTDSRSEGCA